jgi:N-terminal domain of reverse transcriptase
MQLTANVTPGDGLDGHASDWKWAYRTVKNLRQRIFGASREGDLRKVRSLQQLMLRCQLHLYCNRQLHSNSAPLGVRQLLEPWCEVTRSPGSAGAGWR